MTATSAPRLVVALAVAGLLAAVRAGVARPPCAPFGSATMEADRSIVLRLPAHGPHGTVGEGVLRRPPSSQDYAAIAKPVGPLKPAQTVGVCPWPDGAADKQLAGRPKR